MTKQNQNKLKFLGTIEQGAPVAVTTGPVAVTTSPVGSSVGTVYDSDAVDGPRKK